MVILIPARAGSKRIPGKALKDLGGKPLIAWTIESARRATSAWVCSEDHDILACGEQYGAGQWKRPLGTASDDAPDLTWLSLALARFPDEDVFMIRRPTSPFITFATIMRAWVDFNAVPEATAMRAMRPVTEHPMKMWQREGTWMDPAFKQSRIVPGVEVWSTPTQTLPRFYVQTAGLEIIRRATLEAGSLTGDRVLPLFLEGKEALDLNTPQDWFMAEQLLKDDEGGDDV